MRILLWLTLALTIIAGLWLAFSHFVSLADIQQVGLDAKATSEQSPYIVFAALFVAQAVGMAFTLPSKGLLSLLSGALLGPIFGSIVTILGAVAGTTILFFSARYILREKVERWLGDKGHKVEKRLSTHPVRAMIGLRLFITLPYGPITFAAALSSMRYRDFIAGSLVGDLPVVVLYNLAGEQLFDLTAVSHALEPRAVAILVAIGILFMVSTLFNKKKAGDELH
jgi:uncharacterized membrane protein YdjX (TVP38/TMEM64 family)